MRLTAPQAVGPATLTFQFGTHARTTVRINPGTPREVRIPICGSKDARVAYRAKNLTLVGTRSVSVLATAPVFTPSRAACSAS
jgi:hypothetical protein